MGRLTLNNETLEAYKEKIKSDAFTAVNAARMMAELEQNEISNTQIVVTVYDKFYTKKFECGNYSELQASWLRNQIGGGKLTVPRIDAAAKTLLSCDKTTVPITIEVGRLLWSGRVKIAHDNFGDPDRGDFVECELEHDYAWLSKILAWPNFLAPLQVQFPPKGVAIGPAISVLKFILGTQAFRLQSGLWDIVNNLGSLNLDWHSWFGTALSDHAAGFHDVMTMLRTPIYVVPTNPLTDTSPFVFVTWRMDKISSIFEQQLLDNGLVCEVNLWRPGDPQPGNDPLLKAFPLKVPTIVVDIKDRMGIVGPTGTFLDGILRTAVDIQGSVFGEILDPFLNPHGEYKPYGWNIAPLLGVHFVQPWYVLNADHPQSGIQGRLSHHTAEAWRVIIGGKSPAWMNQLINATLAWVLDMIMIVIGLTGIPSNLLDGLFNDVLLAFQLADNYKRRIAMGPYGYPEVFISGAAPYNISAIFALKREMWRSRPYIAGQVMFRNGEPYELGRDFFPGALASVIRDGEIYTDYIDGVTLIDGPNNRADVFLQIGDGKAQEAPVTRVQRKLAGMLEAFNALTLAPGSS